MAKKIKELPKNMYQRLKELRFYCPDDEAGEMFRTTCRLAYQMHGLGEESKAEILYEWATEQAKNSRQWCEKQEMDLTDFVTGAEGI